MFAIVDLTESLVEATAAMMLRSFRDAGGWPDLTLELAVDEICELLPAACIGRVAVDGEVVGVIGGHASYEGHVYELHPLAVMPGRQRQGIGAMLVADFEARVRERGGRTILLGADDEDERTSLGGKDLYPDPLEHLRRIENLGGHPFTFYQKQGYTIVGCVPDANGFGKPDILLAKRLN